MPVELKYKDITEKIIGASFEVHKFLGNACLTARQGFQKIRVMKKSVKSLNPCESVIQTIYDIIKAHGGEIKVDSVKGKGTRFIISLPFV